jgi:Cellulase (glycosyl hydrolase family 5)
VNPAAWIRHRRVIATAAVAWAALVFLVLAPALDRWIPGLSDDRSTPVVTSPVAQKLADLRLMNYYPSTAAWTYMWTKWNPTQLNDDFARIEALGANSVRLNIEPGTFGFPAPSATMTDELDDAIQAAAAHSLTVQLTLFDWWSAYTDTSGSDAWINALLAPHQDDAEIAFIDIKNEIDPGDAQAMAWLEHELPVVRQAAGTIPVTVSVTGPNILADLAALRGKLTAAGTPPDFYDIHYYDVPQHALATFEQAKALVAPSPLFIGETGATTGATTGQAGASAGAPAVAVGDADQDLYLRTVEWAAQTAGLPDAAPWIFQDIASGGAPPEANTGGGELDYGLYAANGTAKPAATSMKALYQHSAISTYLNGEFSVGSGTKVADWTPVRANNGATLAWDGAVGRTSPGSVLLGGTKTSAAGNPAFVAAPVLQPTTVGQTFEMTAWAEGANATGQNRIAICWFTANGGYLSESDSPALPTGTTNWQQLRVTSSAPSGAAYELVYLESGDNSGTVHFDDVTFTEEG